MRLPGAFRRGAGLPRRSRNHSVLSALCQRDRPRGDDAGRHVAQSVRIGILATADTLRKVTLPRDASPGTRCHQLGGNPAMTSLPSKSETENYPEARRFASRYGLEHEHGRRDLTHHWDSYPFGLGSWRRARNVVHGTLHGRSITAFEYHYVLLRDESTERDAFRNFLEIGRAHV